MNSGAVLSSVKNLTIAQTDLIELPVSISEYFQAEPISASKDPVKIHVYSRFISSAIGNTLIQLLSAGRTHRNFLAIFILPF